MTRNPAQPSTQLTVDICVCTYQRRELENAIESIGRLAVPETVLVRVIVADNDRTPSARDLVDSVSESCPFPVSYLHAPAGNISIARNACLDAASGDYVAFVDDDEMVTREWLWELVGTALASGADAVLGPVRALYLPSAPAWMRSTDVHSTQPVWVGGQIRTGYTCNVLLKRASPALSGRRFDIGLGRSGGEDTAFFSGMVRSGGTIAFAPDAWVEEPVPDSRAHFAWLAKRRFRMGQTHGRLLSARTSTPRRPLDLGLACLKAGYCFASAAAFGLSPRRRNVAVLRGLLHAGAVSGLLGMRAITQYGAAVSGKEVGDAA